MPKNNKLIAIVGPTASGKTDLAIFMAKIFNGEIISADSRQVYIGMDIGTGKDKSYPQHLIDICDPQNQYSVAEFQKDAIKIIYDIFRRKKIPILTGGSCLYIDAILKGYHIPKTSLKLRQELEKLSDQDLLAQLKEYDHVAYQKIDPHNRRRILRALESSIVNRRPFSEYKAKKPRFDTLIIGPEIPREELYCRIDKRVDKRIEQGMIEEVKNLLDKDISHKRLQNFGLEYRFIDNYLQNKISKEEMTQRLKFAIHAFARRQLTWLRRNKKIQWVKNQKEAEKIVKKYLTT